MFNIRSNVNDDTKMMIATDVDDCIIDDDWPDDCIIDDYNDLYNWWNWW